MAAIRSKTQMRKRHRNVLHYCDVLLAPDREGWVFTLCNTDGRRAVERIFFDLPIKWNPYEKGDWKAADLNVQAMVELTEDTSRMVEIREAWLDGQPKKIVPQDRGLAFGIAIVNQDKDLRIVILEENEEGEPVFKRLQLTAGNA